LFIRLGSAVDSVGAKRVVLDTLEVLFAGLRDQALIRAELRRLRASEGRRRFTLDLKNRRRKSFGICLRSALIYSPM
jgi:hypothetical protein